MSYFGLPPCRRRLSFFYRMHACLFPTPIGLEHSFSVPASERDARPSSPDHLYPDLFSTARPQIEWSAMTRKWGLDIVDGMHHGQPPTRMLAYLLMYHICHASEGEDQR